MLQVTNIRAWASFLKSTRCWFDDQGFVEVTTDSMVASGAIDAHLDPIKVSYSTGIGELQTSPEFEMKWLLAEHKLPIYQICKSFRDDPLTPIHKKEFSMLEFYRPGADIARTTEDMKLLLECLAGKKLDWVDLTVAEAVKASTGINLHVSLAKLKVQVEGIGVLLSAGDSWDDIFFKLMMERVEPTIGQARPTVLRDFPASLCSLAKIAGEPPVAKRFEIYWKGMELCNGFDELTDAEELTRRVAKQGLIRKEQGKLPHPYPVRLFEAMQKTLPESSGVAVGMDRLFACLSS